MVPQRLFRGTRNPQHIVEFVQQKLDTFWGRWTRNVFASLVHRKMWNAEKRTVRVDDKVIIEDSNSVRSEESSMSTQEWMAEFEM